MFWFLGDELAVFLSLEFSGKRFDLWMETTAPPRRQRSLRVGTSSGVSSNLGAEAELPANMEAEKAPGPSLKMQFPGLSLLTVRFERSEGGPRNLDVNKCWPFLWPAAPEAAVQNPS